MFVKKLSITCYIICKASCIRVTGRTVCSFGIYGRGSNSRPPDSYVTGYHRETETVIVYSNIAAPTYCTNLALEFTITNRNKTVETTELTCLVCSLSICLWYSSSLDRLLLWLDLASATDDLLLPKLQCSNSLCKHDKNQSTEGTVTLSSIWQIVSIDTSSSTTPS